MAPTLSSKSAQPCGCDPGADWTCERHRSAPSTVDARPASDWIATYTGRMFYPLHPRAEDVDIQDIAHALSNVCRFSGHVHQFYSVAQHSVLASLYAPPPHQLAALLHDASEAYICDLSRPVKHDPSMAAYRAVEARLMRVIETVFGVECDVPAVHEVDNRLLMTERRDLMRSSPSWGDRWGTAVPYERTIDPWTPAIAEGWFLARYYRLTTVNA